MRSCDSSSGLIAPRRPAMRARNSRRPIISGFNIIDFATTWKVDLIFRKNREFSRIEFDRRRSHIIGGVRVQIATAEDILIAKLEWAKLGESERQIEDAAGVIERQGEKLDRAYVEHWVEQLNLRTQWQKALVKAMR